MSKVLKGGKMDEEADIRQQLRITRKIQMIKMLAVNIVKSVFIS